MWRAFVLALCCAVPARTTEHGTALAALRDKDEIAIAADSRVLDRLGMRLPDACKIRVADDTVIAINGLALDDASDFDLFKIAEAGLRPHADLSATVKRLAASATEPVSRAVNRVREEDPLVLSDPSLRSFPAGMVLARYERGAPRLGYISFAASGSDPVVIKPELRLCPGDCPTGIAAVLVSPDGAARSLFDAWHPDYWKHPLAPQAVDFVQAQFRGPFNDIGPPIDAIRIADGRIVWIARKDGCREKED